MSREPRKASMDIVNADTTSNSELVLDLVMSYLPTKDCVRTSILSSKWRYRWTTIPSLVFDTTCCPRSCRYSSTAEQSKALTSIINHVLLLHNGSIEVFQVRGLCAVPDIDRWILRVSKDSIKTLVLELWGAEQCKLPSSLFTCGSLSSLKLKNCSLMPPTSSFMGFKNLKCLELESVTLTNDAFEKLISSCPLLKKLTLGVLEQRNTVQYQLPSSLYTCWSLSSLKLGNCLLMPPPSSFKGFENLKCLELESVTLTNDAFEKLISFCPLLENLALNELKEADNLKINSPSLQNISIIDGFARLAGITFEYAMTKLSEIYIDAPERAYASLLDFFIKLPNIQRLELIGCHMGFLSGGSIVESFPFQRKDLYHLAISMGFSFGGEETTLLLHRGSSNSTKRLIENLYDSYLVIELGVWEDNSNCPHEFKQLRWAQMDDFRGKKEELEFLKFVLGNSPVLEEMNVNPNPYPYTCSNRVLWEDVRSIYEFERASKAKIFFDQLVTEIC